MPLGGNSIGWNNNAPANSDSAGFGDDEIRSTRSNVQGAIDAEHNFPAAGGANVGYHRQGSARPYLAPTSSVVSSDGTDARLVINAVDNTLWGARSATSMELMGHPGVLFMSTSSYSAPPKFGTQMQAGQSTTLGSGQTRVTFPSSYSGVPIIVVTGTINGFGVGIQQGLSQTTGFTAFGYDLPSGGVASVNFNWISIGTVSMGVP